MSDRIVNTKGNSLPLSTESCVLSPLLVAEGMHRHGLYAAESLAAAVPEAVTMRCL
jgi:hypothetical protein